MSYIEAYSIPGPAISANGNKQSVITFNGVHRAFVEVTGIGPQGIQGEQGETGPQGEQGETGGLANYVKVLPAGTAITILPAEHLLTNVSGVTVLTGDDKEVDVYKELQTDKTVIIQTNVSFENYKVTIF